MHDYLKKYLLTRYDGYLNQIDSVESSRNVYECYFRASECLLTLKAADLISAKEYLTARDILFDRYEKNIMEVTI